MNLYISTNSFVSDKCPNQIITSNSLFIGDFYTRHPTLGSEGPSQNRNGVAWLYFLEANNQAKIFGKNVRTHYKGRSLDCACALREAWVVRSHIFDELQLDHYALTVHCTFENISEEQKRTRLTFDKCKTNLNPN